MWLSLLNQVVGSLTIYPYDNDTYEPVELGASIFIKDNKNLWRAAQEFNLTLRDLSEEDRSLGIWDGEELVLNVMLHY